MAAQCSGMAPSAPGSATPAPFASRAVTVSGDPAAIAQRSGVQPCLSRASRSAPASASGATEAAALYCAAQCSGVDPSRVLASVSSPFSSRAAIRSTSPSAAQCSACMPISFSRTPRALPGSPSAVPVPEAREPRMARPRRIDRAAAFASGDEDTAKVGKPGPRSIPLDQCLQPVAAMAAARPAFDRERPGRGVQVAQADRPCLA